MARPKNSTNGNTGARSSADIAGRDLVVVDGKRPVCGIVMPISELDGCSEAHWAEILSIITEVIREAGFEPNLVSNADDVGVIQKRIIQNLYDNPIIICDVSGRNANVMFELGMRLAFDKATIIIKDDKTPFSFDTLPIEHVPYRRDLRFADTIEFKKKLKDKVSATYKAFQRDPDRTAFLKHFGQFKIAHLEEKEVSGQEFILEELRELRLQIGRSYTSEYRDITHDEFEVCLMSFDLKENIDDFIKDVKKIPSIRKVEHDGDFGHLHVGVYLKPGSYQSHAKLNTEIRKVASVYQSPRK